ncbi:MAG: sodium/solute symporter, partial [Acidobacteriota bacterium]
MLGEEPSDSPLAWEALPDLPDPLGVAGAFVGSDNGALIVAGGTNFPVPFWETEKQWTDRTWVLTAEGTGRFGWEEVPGLEGPRAYGAVASTPFGLACFGGTDGQEIFSDAFLLRWDAGLHSFNRIPLPDLPGPCAYGAAVLVGNVVYIAGGQSGLDLQSALGNFWRLDLSEIGEPGSVLRWEILEKWPGPPRAFNILAAQHNGFDDCVYLVSGRCSTGLTDLAEAPGKAVTGEIFALQDVYEFNPQRIDQPWRKRAAVPAPVMAGAAVAVGQSHLFFLTGDNGSLMSQTEELRDQHPGFPKRALSYHTITDTWVELGSVPSNQVSIPAVKWNDRIVLASGEIKPRVRTNRVWSATVKSSDPSFGAVNSLLLACYLLILLGIGFYFNRRNRDSEDYLRGGQRIAWWVAGCSIFATMLSSITFMAIPAKAYAQDLTYLVGNCMILAVAPVAVKLALPFFRRIDATSAYEYLQKRFGTPVSVFSSASFVLFHVFRIGIVLSLAALALSTITGWAPATCVLIMGLLSVLYSTIGGVSAVVWTDTVQTVVLLGGAVLCLMWTLSGAEGDGASLISGLVADGKLNFGNLHWDPTSTSLALWVVILGALGQNFSSYVGDQAVVQRYMTTPDQRLAARSIWTAALLAIPASFLFFGLGSGLYAFYKSNPEKLDPTYMTDQILPLFIAREVPVGIAGIIVAAIFAAAQSTISTSMNSTAAALVVDFLRRFKLVDDDAGEFRWARLLTLFSGIAGTTLGLVFIDPANRSLFDSFIRVLGLFMGILGGLFLLGMVTPRVAGKHALLGSAVGICTLFWLSSSTGVNGYLFALIGIT